VIDDAVEDYHRINSPPVGHLVADMPHWFVQKLLDQLQNQMVSFRDFFSSCWLDYYCVDIFVDLDQLALLSV
jgi:hypothetical protein